MSKGDFILCLNDDVVLDKSFIEKALKDIREGKMVILVDDEDRENEGDLTIAAEKVTAEAINHAVSAADFKRASQLITRIADTLFLQGEIYTFLKYI
jgi:GT2 family glycosyltransferase